MPPRLANPGFSTGHDDTMGEAFRLSWLRNRMLQGDSRALVRIDLGERGINYIDLLVHERADGSPAIHDWFDYVQGQTYSNSPRMATSLMVNDDPSLMSRLMGFPDVDRASAELLIEMGRAGQQGNWAAWLDVYRTLPEGVRHSRVLLATRVAAAGAIGDQTEYMNAMSASTRLSHKSLT